MIIGCMCCVPCSGRMKNARRSLGSLKLLLDREGKTASTHHTSWESSYKAIHFVNQWKCKWKIWWAEQVTSTIQQQQKWTQQNALTLSVWFVHWICHMGIDRIYVWKKHSNFQWIEFFFHSRSHCDNMNISIIVLMYGLCKYSTFLSILNALSFAHPKPSTFHSISIMCDQRGKPANIHTHTHTREKKKPRWFIIIGKHFGSDSKHTAYKQRITLWYYLLIRLCDNFFLCVASVILRLSSCHRHYAAVIARIYQCKLDCST